MQTWMLSLFFAYNLFISLSFAWAIAEPFITIFIIQVSCKNVFHIVNRTFSLSIEIYIYLYIYVLYIKLCVVIVTLCFEKIRSECYNFLILFSIPLSIECDCEIMSSYESVLENLKIFIFSKLNLKSHLMTVLNKRIIYRKPNVPACGIRECMCDSKSYCVNNVQCSPGSSRF